MSVRQVCRRQAIIVTRKSWVMVHVGHGSVLWWVRWVMGHKIWPIVSSSCSWRPIIRSDIVVYRTVIYPVSLNKLQGHSPIVCFFSYSFAAVDKISTDRGVARALCNSLASCVSKFLNSIVHSEARTRNQFLRRTLFCAVSYIFQLYLRDTATFMSSYLFLAGELWSPYYFLALLCVHNKAA